MNSLYKKRLFQHPVSVQPRSFTLRLLQSHRQSARKRRGLLWRQNILPPIIVTACLRATAASLPRPSPCLKARGLIIRTLAREVLDDLMPHTGTGHQARHHRRSGSRQKHLHRKPGPACYREGPQPCRAGDRSQQPPQRRQRAGRQDPHGAALHEPGRLYPALSGRNNAWRRCPQNPREHAGLRGCRFRRRDRRDGRGRAVRNRCCRHGRFLPGADDRGRGRRDTGH